MNAQRKESPGQVNALEVFTFSYSESKNEVRTLLENGEVFFVGKDVAKTLGYQRPDNAIRQHCRYALKRCIPHPQSKEKTIDVLTIPEGDVFRLIVNSELPSAQAFESWLMDDLLPTLRKKGYYSLSRSAGKNDFLDMRDVPYGWDAINGYQVRVMEVDGEKMYNIGDINRALQSSTDSTQIVKKLNVKRTNAVKIWIFGATHPSWFTNGLGAQLMISGSRIVRDRQQKQLLLPLFNEGRVQ